jgi:hypothetical protein
MPRHLLPLFTLLAALSAGQAQAAVRYVSPSGSDSAPCTAAAPCQSLNRGYQAAAPGDVVEVADGRYGPQRIQPSSKGQPAVAIQPAAGARPALDDLEIAASHVRVLGPFETRELETANTRGAKATDVLVQDIEVDAQGSSNTPAWIAAVDGVTWRRVEVHNAHDANALLFIDGSYPSNGSVKNLTIEDSSFHDVTVPSGSGTHSQCIYVAGTQGTTIRRSRFYNCAIFDIFQSGDNDPTTDMLIENNVFEAPRLQGGGCCAYFTVRFAWGVPERVTVRNNSSEHQIDFRLGAVDSRVVGNTIQSGIACASGVRFSHNVVTKTRPCSPTDKSVSRIGYRDPANHDFELVSGSPAIDAGDPNDHPPTDIRGLGRHGAPDAGAHEFGGIVLGGGGTPPGGSSPPPAGAGLRRGLVGAWGFDEDGGGAARDASGRGNHGTVKGAARIAGRFGRAQRFDGSRDRVLVAGSRSLDLSRAMTLEAWVRSATRGRRWGSVLVKRRRSGAAYGLYASGREGRAAVRLRTRRVRRLAGMPRRSRRGWHHVASTWNGRVLRLYVDGRLVDEARVTGRAAKSSGPLRIGGAGFRGAIDNVRVYRRALSAADVRAARTTAVG